MALTRWLSASGLYPPWLASRSPEGRPPADPLTNRRRIACTSRPPPGFRFRYALIRPDRLKRRYRRLQESPDLREPRDTLAAFRIRNAPAASVFGLLPSIARYASVGGAASPQRPNAAGGTGNAVSPRQVFPPATPLSERPPFEQGIRQGGKPSWVATARRPLRRGLRLGAFTGAIAPGPKPRRAPPPRIVVAGCHSAAQQPPHPPDLRGAGSASARRRARRTGSGLHGTISQTFPHAPSSPRHGGRALRFCSGAPAFARKSACKTRPGSTPDPL